MRGKMPAEIRGSRRGRDDERGWLGFWGVEVHSDYLTWMLICIKRQSCVEGGESVS